MQIIKMNSHKQGIQNTVLMVFCDKKVRNIFVL